MVPDCQIMRHLLTFQLCSFAVLVPHFLVWHIFLLDRCGSIMTNLPAALPDECDSFSQIETVWPRMLEEYETVRRKNLFVTVSV